VEEPRYRNGLRVICRRSHHTHLKICASRNRAGGCVYRQQPARLNGTGPIESTPITQYEQVAQAIHGWPRFHDAAHRRNARL
jgi:hypothetical protein